MGFDVLAVTFSTYRSVLNMDSTTKATTPVSGAVVIEYCIE